MEELFWAVVAAMFFGLWAYAGDLPAAILFTVLLAPFLLLCFVVFYYYVFIPVVVAISVFLAIRERVQDGREVPGCPKEQSTEEEAPIAAPDSWYRS
ncbi:MAG: hypothetical protein LBO00_05155 [Zoogloeaceae bacterium]|jgi:hypothetical protein|nr:hypothetical protein [Zoogloeaceae bacterium]